MRRITKGAEISVMRSDDHGAATRSKQPVKLFYRSDDVGYVLNDVNGADLPERIVTERIREVIKVSDYIRVRTGVAIEADSAWVLVDAAAHIQNRKCLAYTSSRRIHSSSVSRAKSA